MRDTLGRFQQGNIPWNKGKPFSEELRRKMSEIRKRLCAEGKIIPWNRGKRLSKEHKKKLSQSHKSPRPWRRGISPSEETRHKISEANKGQIPWNKGRTYEEMLGINKAQGYKKKISKTTHRLFIEGKTNGYRGSVYHQYLVNTVASWLDNGKNKVEIEKAVPNGSTWRLIDILVNDKVCFEIGDCRREKIQDITQNGFTVVHLPYSCFERG